MFANAVGPRGVAVVLSSDELRLIHNALNEVVNGIAIADEEFRTRLGATRKEADALLVSVSTVLESAAGVEG